ncbi:MAG: peroxiredoxin family protein [Candidatus Omnitrophica bacterium]|nr:peroxiredoxin family protein [Candidatus Omnitrophota bacterium]MCM8806361.1 peroxiredoxin family protein [Candidatus Omnitrophota bacterium]
MKSILIFLIFASFIFANPNKAPDFTLKDPYNNEFSLSMFKGKTIILNFFKIYCGGKIAPETEKLINELNKICKEFCKGKFCKDGDLTIISITVASCPTTDLKEWVEKKGIKWFIGNDLDDYNLDIIKSYASHLKYLKDPCLIFINKNSEIVYKSNYISAEEIKKKLKELKLK